MSFYVNNTEVKSTYFNSQKVKSIYYNNVLVWKTGFDWGSETGTADATWWANLKSWVSTEATVSELSACVGKTKSVTLTSSVLGTTTHLVRCIGYNCDGNNTLTFQTANCLYNTTTTSTTWSSSSTRSYCQNYYNYFPGKASVKTVSKGTNTSYNTSSVSYTSETVFLPSIYEMGITDSSIGMPVGPEYCYGYSTAYQYYNSNSRRIKYRGDSSSTSVTYWTRSRNTYSSSGVSIIIGGSNYSYTPNGSGSYNRTSTACYIAPAFVIG